MQNINEIMKEFGVEIATDKQADFNKKVTENYLTRAEHEKKLGKAETDRDGWKEKAEAAEETLAKFDGVDLETMQREMNDYKVKAENAKREYEQKIEQRDLEDKVKEKYSSVKVKEDMNDYILSELKGLVSVNKNGDLIGFDEAVESLKKSRPSAFVNEEQESLEQNKVKFTQQVNKANLGNLGGVTKKDIMSIKDTTERQSAIAQNLHLFEGQ